MSGFLRHDGSVRGEESETVGGEPTKGFKDVLRQLALPLYLPVLAQAAAFNALSPVLTLLALGLGFSVPGSAAIGLISGIVGVVGPVPAGRFIQVVGERGAMILTGVAMVAGHATGFWLVTHASRHGTSAAHRWGLVGVMLLMALGQAVWGLARQSWLGSALDPRFRARAMSTFGGMMRIGQIIGPVLGAAIVAGRSTAWVFLFAAGVMTLAVAMVTLFLVPMADAGRGRNANDAPLPPTRLPWWRDPAMRPMAVVAMGTAPLQMARVTRPVLLPLVGHALGLGAATISLIFGIAAIIEIAMFVPAGIVMDRYGRTAVIVPCLFVVGLGYLLLTVLSTTVGGHSPQMALVTVGGSAIVLALGNGLGAGIVMTLGQDLTPEQDRTRQLARWMTMTGVGPLAGPLLVSAITLVAPVGVAGAAVGLLCVGGSGWMLRVLPALTPNPPAGPFHRPQPSDRP
ncbi:MFS transporter [Aestuariimicrobium sp. p3-SID1156]|uniref:MFS transporter n=1 Tax=Aestuariimicrobium sp. p3-SID1156 TaxID=2916038 RepID=UPI00223AD26E|nr:MFS transporter [Aestuariimicrobium sp. p3-SID1156]MCT1460337.1 MFS transporter [Aestuariimicrobium sp. p3-SID1156]